MRPPVVEYLGGDGSSCAQAVAMRGRFKQCGVGLGGTGCWAPNEHGKETWVVEVERAERWWIWENRGRPKTFCEFRQEEPSREDCGTFVADVWKLKREGRRIRVYFDPRELKPADKDHPAVLEEVYRPPE